MPTAAPPRGTLMRKPLRAPTHATPRRTVKPTKDGIVTAIVAVTGVVDAVNDLIVPGAFQYSLSIRRPKVVNDHEWGKKAGRVLHVEEWMPGDPRLPKFTKDGQPWPAEAGALVATMQYNMGLEYGRESYEWVRFYAESDEAEFSIGYKVPDGKSRKRHDGVRVILQVNLFEFSHVLFGAAPLTMALEVKSLSGATAGTVSAPALGEAEREDDDEVVTETPSALRRDRAPLESKTAAAVMLSAKGMDMRSTSRVHMRGSYEERSKAIRAAVCDVFESECVEVVATYDSEVVVEVFGGDAADGCSSYLIPYQYNPTTGTVALDEAERVSLSIVARPGERAEPYEVEHLAETVLDTFDALHRRAGYEGKAADLIRVKAAELHSELNGPAEESPDGPAEDVPQYDEDSIPPGDWGMYSKTEPIEALRMNGPFGVTTREGHVHCSDGWLALDSEGYPYPIAADEFAAVYAPYEAEVESPSPRDDSEVKGMHVERDREWREDTFESEGDADEEEMVTLTPEEALAPLDELAEATKDYSYEFIVKDFEEEDEEG